ncbi:MAG: hypothetical protein ABSD31_03725 [Candidatus Binataceae bacterium]
MAIASAIGYGCDFGPPTPPIIPLTEAQTVAVLNCQRTIKQQGLNFVTVKLTNVEACLDDVLGVQLQAENGHVPSEKVYQNQLNVARNDCANKFQQVSRVSTAMVNAIVNACGGVQNIILPPSGYDPLEFGALAEFAYEELNDSEPITNVTELAGAICGAKEEAVDWMLFLEVPRMGNLLDILNGDQDGGPFGIFVETDVEVPYIELDERCNGDFAGNPSLPPI